ncbi:MAG: beta-lactamase family protein [Holosporales bacterium]|jgi:CubicO group peptidase (beta-lactamase class C family)|nr:beta-lactamase family protein [Holosporales bacterium]
MFKIFQKIAALLPALGIVCSLCSAKLTDAELLSKAKKMEKIIQDGMKKIKVPGVAFSVSRKDKVIYSAAFGKTTIDSNSPKPVSPTTLFPVSSLSKNVTAILVGILVDKGILSFDDKVRKYIPDFFVVDEETSNKFTVLDLISHRSGFKSWASDSLLWAGYDNKKILNAFKYLKQRPGNFRKRYGYQNALFGVVGEAIERATGEKYEDVVQKYIFDVMEMKNSSAISIKAEASAMGYFKYLLSRFSHDREKLGFFKAATNLILLPSKHESKSVVTNHARYLEDIIPLEEIGFFQKFTATSGISFSAEDFAKWLAMLANKGAYNGKRIVSEKTFGILASNLAEKNIKDEDYTFIKSRYSRDNAFYGAGVFKFKYSDNGKNAREILFHMGGIYGSSAFFAVSFQDDVAVGVISNLGGVSTTLFCEYMVNQFLDLCFGFSKIDWVQTDIDRKKHFREVREAYNKTLSEQNPSPMERTEKYTGIYTDNGMYGDIKIMEKKGDLYVSNGIKEAKLTHINGGIFTFPGKDMIFAADDENEYASFFKDEYGNIDSLYLSCFDENNTIFKKK